MRIRAIAGVTILCVLLAASACGADPDPGPAAPPAGSSASSGPSTSDGPPASDVCALVSNAELTEIVGKPITSSQSFVTGGDPACMWYDADKYDSVQVIRQEAEDFQAAQSFGTPRPLAGIGQEAVLTMHNTIVVRTAGGALFAQSYWPVADGQISADVRDAAKGSSEEEMAKYEASLRIARLVLGRT